MRPANLKRFQCCLNELVKIGGLDEIGLEQQGSGGVGCGDSHGKRLVNKTGFEAASKLLVRTGCIPA